MGQGLRIAGRSSRTGWAPARRSTAQDSVSPTVGHVLDLQRTAGNRAVTQLLQGGPLPVQRHNEEAQAAGATTSGAGGSGGATTTGPTGGATTTGTTAAGGATTTAAAGGATTATAAPTGTTPAPTGDLSDADALEATRHLPAWVQSGAGGHALSSDEERREFLRAGRDYFGTYQAALDHFDAIEPANVPGHPYMHARAKERLEAAVTAVGGHAPASDTAFSFRNRFTSGTHFNPTSMHTLGYAVDYDARNLPRIGRDEMADFISAVTGQEPHADFGGNYATRRSLIRNVGNQTAAGSEHPGGAAGASLLSTVDHESERMALASRSFQQSLGANGQAVVALRQQYFAAPRGQAGRAQRDAIAAQLIPLVQPWLDAVDRRITALQSATDRSSRSRLQRLTALRQRLNDQSQLVSFVFGSSNASVVSGPSAGQLLSRGFFNVSGPDEEHPSHVTIPFLHALVQHGFELGEAWSGADTDSMHMELVVGRGE